MQIINTNIASLNAQRNLNGSQSSVNTSLQRLSSGLRINSAKDDAAGLAISERFTSQINGMSQAVRNANDGVSLAQTAEGDLTQIGNNLQRIRTLASQASNSTNSDEDRADMQTEVSQLLSEIDRVAKQSNFNGTNLLDGSFTSKLFQVGANAGQAISVNAITDARTENLGQVAFEKATFTAAGAATSVAASDSQYVAGTISIIDANGNHTNLNINSIKVAKDDTGAVTTAAYNNAIVSAVNSQIGETGVFAEVKNGDIQLTSVRDGTVITAGTAAATATTAGVYVNLTQFTAASNATVTTLATDAKTAAVIGGSAGFTAAADTSGANVSEIDISTELGAQKALSVLDSAINEATTARSDLGALQNRFTSVVNSLQTTSENLSASRSAIQDTDFAAETANFTQGKILQQAGTAMLSQANALPNNVLSLLQNL